MGVVYLKYDKETEADGAEVEKLLVAALAAVTVGGGAVAAGNLSYFQGEKVINVLDGDTFVTENRQPIRLAGLDAPELINCMGNDAKEALSTLILGKRVRLRNLKTDPFRRIMAAVYLNSTLVNEVMIRAGMAQYTEYQGSEKTRLVQANNYARNTKTGIYGPECTQPEPPNSTCVIKGNYDINDRMKIYYTPTCNNYIQVIIMKSQGDEWFCTEAQARKAGFVRSDTCR